LSARLQDTFIVGTGKLGREMECESKLKVANQKGVASAGLDKA
jgi:hypothetical protein